MNAADLHFRPAEISDIDTIVKWRHETAQWLATEHGSDQWSTEYPRWKLQEWVERGETWMISLTPDDDPIATLTLSSQGAPELWTPEELAEPALYLNKLNVVRTHAGEGIGSCLVQWSIDEAHKARAKLRIDVWTTNNGLRRYYENLGFQYLRTVSNTVSGALYEIS